MANNSRIKISVKEGLIEIEGTETFIDQKYEMLRPVLETLVGKSKEKPAKDRMLEDQQVELDGETDEPEEDTLLQTLEKYENVFEIGETNKIHILQTPPGDGKQNQTVSVALLLLLANELRKIKEVSLEDIRQACEDHACLDADHFAQAFRRNKQYFLISGTGKDRKAKLTVPGRKQAQKLAIQLNKEK